jgi:hypothetical protein
MRDRIIAGSSERKEYILRCGDKREYKEAKGVLKRIGGIIDGDFPSIHGMSVSIKLSDFDEIAKYRPYEPVEVRTPNTHL